MSKPIVSVIVPVYNVSKYLRKCLDSIVGQTYDNLEIILVNDGSTDNSGKICDEYAQKDNRIKVIHQNNGGLSYARNTGIELMHGQYVTFVDSDDYIAPNYIDSLLNIAIMYKTNLVVGSYVKVSDNYREKHIKKESIKNVEQYTAIEAKYLMLYRKKIPMYAHGKLYNSLLFKNIRFPQGKLFEDMPTTWKIMKLVNTIQYIDEPLYFYRQRSDSIVNKKFSHNKMDQVFMAKDILDEVFENKELYKAAVSMYFFCLSNMYAQVDKANMADWNYLENELKKIVNIVKKDKKNNLSLIILAFFGGLHIKFIRIIGKMYKYLNHIQLKMLGSI